jgi:hypothetical protein
MRKSVCMNQDAGLDGSDKPGMHMRMWFLFFANLLGTSANNDSSL